MDDPKPNKRLTLHDPRRRYESSMRTTRDDILDALERFTGKPMPRPEDTLRQNIDTALGIRRPKPRKGRYPL